jgi:hypothetical protein
MLPKHAEQFHLLRRHAHVQPLAPPTARLIDWCLWSVHYVLAVRGWQSIRVIVRTE